MGKFRDAFKDNYYLSEEFASFCSKVSGMKTRRYSIGEIDIPVIKNKNISIHAYSEEMKERMIKGNIRFISVENQINKKSKKPSPREYALFLKKKHSDAIKGYSRFFSDGLKQAKRYPYKVLILQETNEKILKEVYQIYKAQMRRLNSFLFPKEFFEEFMGLSSSKLFLLYLYKEIAAYSFCFENKENLYASVGGSKERFFKKRCNNRLYDELIQYACYKGLNVHFGLGMHGSGSSAFKEGAGITLYKCTEYPNYSPLLKLGNWFLRFGIVGKILRNYSLKHPKRTIFRVMPFT